MFETGPNLSRVALYARYSSNRQNPKSIDDQLLECRRLVAELGGTVIAEYTDAKFTGATAHARPAGFDLIPTFDKFPPSPAVFTSGP